MEDLAGKAIVVTGAASGIGEACVTRLVAEGAAVVGADISSPADDLLDAEDFTFVDTDVTDEEAVADLMSRAVERHGRIDGLITAAGIGGGGPVHILDLASWDEVLAVNLTGTFLACKHAIAQMLEQEAADGERGSVVTIASVEGLEGTSGGSVYNASKGGVVILTKNIAIDYGARGIRANTICPGFVDTPLTRTYFDMEGMGGIRDHMIAEHKLGRAAQPEEIASAATFLLSRDSSFMTGGTLVVDGGYTAGRDHGIVEMLGL